MVGIDIGSKTIKVIELNKSSSGWSLKSSGVIGYSGSSPDKMVDEKELESLAEIVKKLVKKINISSKEVVISIPEHLVFSRVIKFPRLSDEEVSAAVKWEAEQYIPIPVAEAVVEHTILDSSEKSPNVSVLLVAAPKVVVEKYVKVFRLAGLAPVAAETELLALSRSLSSDSGTSLLLDLGVTSSEIAIVTDAKLSFSRSIPIAGDAMTRSVSQGLGVDLTQAEEYKKTYGLKADQLEGRVKAALDPVLRMIVDEIKKSIHFYQNDNKKSPPTSVVITGGSIMMPNLAPYLTKLLGIETIIGNPFSKVKLDPNTAKSIAPYAPLYGVAVGLAMREE